MNHYIAQALRNPLISGSGIIFIGSFLGNIFHFLFNLFMSRNLSISEFGILASLLSLVTLPSLLYSAITPTIVNFAAKYFANEQYSHVSGLYKQITRIALILGGLFFLLFAVFSSPIAAFFHIQANKILITFAGLLVCMGFISIVNLSLVQAKFAFGYLALISFLTGFLRFVFGVILVLLGFKVLGGVVGLIFTAVVIYGISFIPLKIIFSQKGDDPKPSFGSIAKYAMPATISLFSLTCFITTDILILKHFLHPNEAGLYAGLALIGKVIYYFSSPIGMAMFPIIVQKKAKNENYTTIFLLAMFFVFPPSAALTLFYYLFPDFSVLFFTKRTDYLAIAGSVWVYGVYTTLYSLLSVITNYFLSINKTVVAIPLTIGAASQAILIWIFHSSILQVLTISIAIVASLLTLLFIYYFYTAHKDKVL